jgi:hypothetical protein
MVNSDDLALGDVLKIAVRTFKEKNLEDVVVASTRGETGLHASRLFNGLNANLVVIGHSVGFREVNKNEFNIEKKRAIEKMGGKVLFSTMPFHNINDAIQIKAGRSVARLVADALNVQEIEAWRPRAISSLSAETIIADTLRMMGQGTKVCVEIVAMACDSGHIASGKNVLAIAGAGRGADTVLIIRSANSRRLFDMKIVEVIVKPQKL